MAIEIARDAERGPKVGLEKMGETSRWLLHLFDLMLAHFGSRGWWPAETRFEVAVGAILTQSVSWNNASLAVQYLAEAGYLDPRQLDAAPEDEIARLIVPSRYYRQKARKLKAFTRVLVRDFDGDIGAMLAGKTQDVRRRLLAIHGIGPETADCILLYAGEHPIFVVDAYTRRIFARLGVWDEGVGYDAMQAYFHAHLPPDVPLYNEYHALIDGVGNRYCRARRPLCHQCPLLPACPAGQQGGGELA